MQANNTATEGVMISDNLLSRLTKILRSHMGLHFPKKTWNSLRQKIIAAMKDFDFEDGEKFGQWLSSVPLTKSHIELLASHFTVGETYFFRESALFSVLEKHFLSDLIQSRRSAGKHLRIWSAGCATGEEPYSIAILFRKLIPDYSKWNISILATDINPRFLQKARDGIYSKWSFRSTPSWVIDEYFRHLENGLYMIAPYIKQMVQFSYINLAEDVYPSLLNNTNAMDMIFCRNVLMYLTPEHTRSIVDRLYRSLINGGLLMLSPVETPQVITPQFVRERHDGTVFYRKYTRGYVSYKKAPDISQTRTEVPPAKSREIVFQRGSYKAKTAEETKTSVSRHKKETQVFAKDIPPKGLYDEALDFYTSGNYIGAEEKLMNLINAGYHNPKALILLARVYANQGNLDTALDWCEKALNEDKLDPDLHYLRALILEEQGKDAQALESLKRTLYLDSSFTLAHFSLGNLALKQGRRGEGEKHFMNTLDILSRFQPDGVVHESEGITAGRLVEIISSLRSQHSGRSGPAKESIAGAPNKLQRSRSRGLHQETPL